MTPDYSALQSPFLRACLDDPRWNDHEQIEHLLNLYQYILQPPKSVRESFQFFTLKHRFDAEYLVLLKETNPGEFRKEVARRSLLALKREAERALSIPLKHKQGDDWLEVSKAGNKS